MTGQRVGRFVGDDRGQVGVGFDVLEQTGVDPHLAAWKTEGIGTVVILENDELPPIIRPVRGFGDAFSHPAHPGLEGLVFRGLGFLFYLVKGLIAQAQLLLLGDHEDLLAAGVRRGGASGHKPPDHGQQNKPAGLPVKEKFPGYHRSPSRLKCRRGFPLSH